MVNSRKPSNAKLALGFRMSACAPNKLLLHCSIRTHISQHRPQIHLLNNSPTSFQMALRYSKSFLMGLYASAKAFQPLCCYDLWRRLADLGISKAKPTRKGFRGGKRIHEESRVCDAASDLYNGSRGSLSIQNDTSRNGTLLMNIKNLKAPCATH